MAWKTLVSSNHPPPTLNQIVAFERQLGTSLPPDYRDFMLANNGGLLVVDHTLETQIEGFPEQTGLFCLYPLTDGNASFSSGVIECRDRRRASKVGIETALEIGCDGGTGFFFIMLSPRFFGQVYFAYKDELKANSPEWGEGIDAMPSYMGLISRSFSELGELIANQ